MCHIGLPYEEGQASYIQPYFGTNKVLGLSFDDGPETTVTPRILDVLQQENVKATFFICTANSGISNVEANTTQQTLVRRMVNEGHQLASHSHNHFDMATLTPSQMQFQITEVQRVVELNAVLGAGAPKLTAFRWPFGSPAFSGRTSSAYATAADVLKDYAVDVAWAIDTNDWQCTSGTATQKRDCVFNNFKGTGAVGQQTGLAQGHFGMVLMHMQHQQTADALPLIIQHAKSNGYQFKLADDIIKAKYGASSFQLVYGSGESTAYPSGTPWPVPGRLQAEDFDNGGEGAGYHDMTTGNSGGAYRSDVNVDLQATSDVGGGYNVGWAAAGEWLQHTVNVGSAGTYDLDLRVAATSTGKTVRVLVDGVDRTGAMTVPNTGAWQTYQTITKTGISLDSGIRKVRFVFDQGSVNLNWLEFRSAGVGCGSLPSGWSSQNTGSVTPAGSSCHSGGTYTIAGAGADIWGTADAFRFTYRNLPGDGEISARIAGVQNTHAWAKAGVMIRESLAAGSRHAMMVITPTSGLSFQRRTTTGGASESTSGGAFGSPRWVRVKRAGSAFTAFQSSDGTNWTQVGSAVTIPMASNVYVGLAVTSHSNGTLCQAVFDNVAVGSCSATTCAAQGKNCGTIDDGCGVTLNCGTCTSPQTCGGGGVPNVCGDGSGSCSPTISTYTQGKCNETVVYETKLYSCISQAAGVNGEPTGCGTPGVYCSTITPTDAAWGTSAWQFLQNCP